MTLSKLSPKQKMIFKWCHMSTTKDKYDAIICDGAVRSGKTVCMIVSYIIWAMRYFDGATFGICGKSVQSAERNIIVPLQQSDDLSAYFEITYTRSLKLLTVSQGEQRNYFYVFGGKDESSAALIQGITLSGVLLDEVALMPESFVNQAIARTLSVPIAKLWFNCNPESPSHWFYKEWVEHPARHNALRLHFLMEDNPILTPKEIEKAESMYSGVFRDRYILGLWKIAEGLVYPNFSKEKNVTDDIPEHGVRYISIDYGTHNPFSAGLWVVTNGKAYREKEYYHSGRDTNILKTDEEYYEELCKLAGDYPIREIIIDPSASSFIECIRRHGKYRVRHAVNDVLNGIHNTATLLDNQKVFISPTCKDCIREFEQYAWDDKANEDKVIKENDHAMDDVRYFVNTVLVRQLRWTDWRA